MFEFEKMIFIDNLIWNKVEPRMLRNYRGYQQTYVKSQNCIGTPVVETLVEVWRKFGVTIGTLDINPNTSNVKIQKHITQVITGVEINKLFDDIQQNTVIISESEALNIGFNICYVEGTYFTTSQIEYTDVVNALKIFAGVHPLQVLLKELLQTKTILEFESFDFEFLDKIDFKISSLGGLLNTLGFTYVDSCLTLDRDYLVGVTSKGIHRVYTLDGDIITCASRNDFITKISTDTLFNY